MFDVSASAHFPSAAGQGHGSYNGGHQSDRHHNNRAAGEEKHHSRHPHAGKHNHNSVQHHPGSAFKAIFPNGSGNAVNGAHLPSVQQRLSGGPISGSRADAGPDGSNGGGGASGSGRRADDPQLIQRSPDKQAKQAKQQLHQQVLQQLQILGSQQGTSTGLGQVMPSQHHQQPFGDHAMQDTKQDIGESYKGCD